MIFTSNGDDWRVERVAWDDPVLIDRTGSLCVATTDPKTMTVYIADWLNGSFLARVLIHEMAHATMWSNGLIPELRRMVSPEHWIEAEEWVCNFLADRGLGIYDEAAKILGGRGIDCIPPVLESLVA